MNYKNFIGIDVAKEKIDIFNLSAKKHITISNRTDSIKTALKDQRKEDTLVVLENTGGYEKKCIEALSQMGFAIHKTENRKFKKYIESLGQKAKTDLIDAKALAQYGQERQKDLKLFNKPAAEEQELKELLRYLEELKKIRAAERNRLKSAGYGNIRYLIEETLRRLDEMIDQVEKKIKELLAKNPIASKKMNSLIQYIGVSFTTASKLMVYLPELGNLRKEKIVALSGLAPYVCQSGTIKKHATTAGSGRPIVKKTLYMAALSAIRYNPQLAAFYKRLLTKGKHKMIALVACMRKMIIHLNAIVRKDLYEGGVAQ